MKQSLVCASVLILGVACSSDNNSSVALGSSGAGASAAAGVSGAGVSAAAGSSGAAGSGPAGGGAGMSAAGGGAGGGGGSAGGGGGSAGAAGGPGALAFKCPPGPYPALSLGSAKAARIPGAPPTDGFNTNNFGNVEGPVWIGDSLYFSELKNGDIPDARILKLAPGGAVTVAVMNSGSNGLAVDASGVLWGAVHLDGSVSQFDLATGTRTPIITKYNNTRFTSPNDLAIRSDGTIYFSDPMYQNSANPQMAERLYWVSPAPTRTVTAVAGAPSTPNGVTLSPDEMTLYVSGSGLKKFTVLADGSLTNPTDIPGGDGGDGMVVDCAGNLYVAGNQVVTIFPISGAAKQSIAVDGTVTSVTNVAFGGPDRKTLYITAQGNDGERGLFSIALNMPGFPY